MVVMIHGRCIKGSIQGNIPVRSLAIRGREIESEAPRNCLAKQLPLDDINPVPRSRADAANYIAAESQENMIRKMAKYKRVGMYSHYALPFCMVMRSLIAP
jgi:hypothetical protein